MASDWENLTGRIFFVRCTCRESSLPRASVFRISRDFISKLVVWYQLRDREQWMVDEQCYEDWFWASFLVPNSKNKLRNKPHIFNPKAGKLTSANEWSISSGGGSLSFLFPSEECIKGARKSLESVEGSLWGDPFGSSLSDFNCFQRFSGNSYWMNREPIHLVTNIIIHHINPFHHLCTLQMIVVTVELYKEVTKT